MRRFAAVTSVLMLVGSAAAVLTGATASYAAGASLTPGSTWTLETPTSCESDTFGVHSFTTAIDYGTGDQGTYKGTKKLKVTWTKGQASGDVFKGTWHKKSGVYTGTDTHGGVSSVATLSPATSVGCSTVTSTPTMATLILGATNSDNATVMGAEGIAPTGTVTFYVCGPEPTLLTPATTSACTSTSGTEVGTPAAVIGSGSIATSHSVDYSPGSAGTYCFLAVYSGDTIYQPSSDATTSDECFTVTATGSSVTTAPGSASIALGSSDTDTATVAGDAGDVAPSGTVTFIVCGPLPPAAACDSHSENPVQVGGPVTLTPGTTTSTVTSDAFTPSSAGTYCFFALYSGDDSYNASSDSSPTTECFTVDQATPVVSSTPAQASVDFGRANSDTATVVGTDGITPTGSVDFTVCPGSATSCTSSTSGAVDLGSVALSESENASVVSVDVISPNFTATTAGDYCFVATYSGDTNYLSGSDASTSDECFTVNTPAPTPLALGSAENSFGTGALSLGTGDPTHIWAAVNGYCTSKENGDEFLSAFDATWDGTNWLCSGTPDTHTPTATANDEYNPAGYSYDIVTPTTAGLLAAPLTVQAYDPAYEPAQCAGQPGGTVSQAGGQTPDLSLATGTSITTTYTLAYAPTPDNSADDTAVTGPYVAASGDATTCGQWATLFTIPTGSPNGYYRLQVSTTSGEANSDGVNAFGLRVFSGAAFARCSTVASSSWYSSACPVVQGETALSVYANESGSTGTFSLDQVPAADAGSTMDVNLFDPGEGSNDLELLNPDGVAVPFTWKTIDSCPLPPPHTASTDCAEDLGFTPMSGSGTDLDLTGAITPPVGERSNSVFNDRQVQLSVVVPANYTADNGGWWSVKYISGNGTVQDRTTWTVTIIPAGVVLDPPLEGQNETSLLRAHALHSGAIATGTATGARVVSGTTQTRQFETHIHHHVRRHPVLGT
jgi:hypothetical protein